MDLILACGIVQTSINGVYEREREREREVILIECYCEGEVHAPYWENPISSQRDLIGPYEIIKNLSELLYSTVLKVIPAITSGPPGNPVACVCIHTQKACTPALRVKWLKRVQSHATHAKHKACSLPWWELPWKPMSHISERRWRRQTVAEICVTHRRMCCVQVTREDEMRIYASICCVQPFIFMFCFVIRFPKEKSSNHSQTLQDG